MRSYRIAEVAEMVGVPTTTLRYYEDIDLVTKPARGSNGYRRYNDADVARLRLAVNAKDLGIPLDDVRQLVGAYEVEDCSRVAHRVVEMVSSRVAQTQARISEMTALSAQLQAVAERLADAPNGQACGADCPCATVSLDVPAAGRRTLLPELQTTTPAAEPPIACTLDAAALPDRLSEWQALLLLAVRREEIDGGVAVIFHSETDLAARAASLAAAEQACCAFFEFTLHLAGGELRMEVRAPHDASDSITALLGQPG